MKVEVVVNDTNILVDMHTAGLLPYIGNCRVEFHTVDFVIDELHRSPYDRPQINKLIEDGTLKVAITDIDEMQEIQSLYSSYSNKTNLSFVDCAVMHYAKKNGYRLLTGDKKLRNHAVDEGIIVSGILWVVNLFIKEGLVTRNDMIEKLEIFLGSNPRLPKILIQEKINELKKQ